MVIYPHAYRYVQPMQNRGAPIRIVGVVIVGVAAVVDIAEIVRVRSIWRTKPPVDSRMLYRNTPELTYLVRSEHCSDHSQAS